MQLLLHILFPGSLAALQHLRATRLLFSVPVLPVMVYAFNPAEPDLLASPQSNLLHVSFPGIPAVYETHEDVKALKGIHLCDCITWLNWMLIKKTNALIFHVSISV